MHSGALQLAVSDGRLAANPAQRLKLPEISRSQKRFLSHTQVAALAELAGLQVRDFDAATGRLHIRTTMVEVNGFFKESSPKDYEERFVPMPASIAE